MILLLVSCSLAEIVVNLCFLESFTEINCAGTFFKQLYKSQYLSEMQKMFLAVKNQTSKRFVISILTGFCLKMVLMKEFNKQKNLNIQPTTLCIRFFVVMPMLTSKQLNVLFLVALKLKGM